MNPIKLVIFDLDGTLADTMDGIVEGLNRTMRDRGYPTHDRKSVLGFVNYHTRQFIEEALPLSRRTEEEIDRVLSLYDRHYKDTYALTRPFAGIPELLDRLSPLCLLAMNSNKQDAFVKALADNLFPRIPFIAAEGYRPDRPGKPDPAMANAILETASRVSGEPLIPDQCVYIGDSDVDLMTAQNAGMHCISVSWGYRSHEFLRALGDQPIAATPQELWSLLQQLGINA